MTDARHRTSSRFTRREALMTMGAFSMTAPATGAKSTDPALYRQVAERARSLAGKGTALSILIPNGSNANVLPVVALFEDLSGIKVTVESTPVDDINSQLALDALSGEAQYDLALPATFGIPDLAAGNVIRPLTNLAAKHEPAGFRDEVLYATGDTFDGQIYGLQADGDTYMMFYHKEWMENPTEIARYQDRFGADLAIPRTWQELDRQMAFFHRPDADQFGGALFRTRGYLAWEWWVRFHAKGVWPLSNDLEPQIASDAGVEALEDMIRASAFLYPHARSSELFENWHHYGEGKTYCNIGWGGSQKYLNGPESKMRGKMLYGFVPAGEFGGKVVDMPYFNWGWNYVVTTASTQPELAYLFALFASTSEVSTLAVRQRDGFFDPFRAEHYQDALIEETYSREFLAVHQASLRKSIPDLYLARQSEYFGVLSEALDSALRGDLGPEQALKRASTQWSLFNLRSGHSSQTDRWRALRAKYPANVQAVLKDL